MSKLKKLAKQPARQANGTAPATEQQLDPAVAACQQAIQAALQKHECRLQVVQITVDGQPSAPQVRVVAVQQKKPPVG